MEQLIEKFVDDLLINADLDTLPQEFKEQYKVRIGGEVQRRIGIYTLQALPKEDLMAFDEIMSQKGATPEQIILFLKERIPNYEELMAAKLLEFKDEFLQQAKELGLKK